MIERELIANWNAVMYPQPEPVEAMPQTVGEEQAQEILLAQAPTDMPQGFGGVSPGQFLRGTADTAAGTIKGAVQGFVGLPGDLEEIGRLLVNLVGGDVSEEAFLATTDDIKKMLDKYAPLNARTSERGQKVAETVGELVAPGGYVKGAKEAIRGVKAGAKKISGGGKKTSSSGNATPVSVQSLFGGAEAEIAAQKAAKDGNYSLAKLKSGDEIRLVILNPEDDKFQGAIYAFDKNGNRVGALDYAKYEDAEGMRINPNVYVDEKYRRQGLANQMYDLAEQDGALIPNINQEGQLRSEMGQAFRESREKRQSTKKVATPARKGTMQQSQQEPK